MTAPTPRDPASRSASAYAKAMAEIDRCLEVVDEMRSEHLCAMHELAAIDKRLEHIKTLERQRGAS